MTDNYYKSIVKKVLLKKYLNIEVFSRDLDKCEKNCDVGVDLYSNTALSYSRNTLMYFKEVMFFYCGG